ncbi:MAG: hypothetical protein PHH01_04940 [Patescibacteria group bacterium]|nr:hypothetical protein [Patescibacteria group bacterium]
MNEEDHDGRLRFSYLGKQFDLRPFIVQNGQKVRLGDLSATQASQVNYQTVFDSQRRFTKWTNKFNNSLSIAQSGYTIETGLSVDFQEETTDGKLSHLSAIIDNKIEVSFDDLIWSGYTVERQERNILISGLPAAGEVALDPQIFFYSTTAVDGSIHYCDGDVDDYAVNTTSNLSDIGLTKQVACVGGFGYEYRSYLSFDTSGLDDAITITSSTINTYADSYNDRASISVWDVEYYIGVNQIGASLTSGDWGAVGSSRGTLDWAETTGWKAFSIPTPDSYVSKTGDTDFELRNTWGGGVGSGQWAYVNMRTTDYTGVNSDPYLEVVWSASGYWGSQFVTSGVTSMGSLNGSTLRAGLSFTDQSGGELSAFRIYLQTVSSSPTYRFGIQSDSSGNPSGTWLSGSSTSSYVDVAPTSTGWNTFTLASTGKPTLVAGTVYHIVVQYVSGTIGAGNLIAIRRTAIRNQRIPYRDTADTASNTEWYNGASWADQGAQPVYFLDYTSATDEGDPSDTATLYNIYTNAGTTYNYGEKFVMYDVGRTVTTIGLYTFKLGLSCGNPSADLLYDIRDSSDTQLASGTLVAAGTVTGTARWWDATLSSPINLYGGQTYRVYFYSAATTACSYRAYGITSTNSAEYNAITYNGTSSRNGSCTTTCTSDANWTYLDNQDITFRFTVDKIFTPRSQNWRLYGDEDTATPVYPYAAENTIPPDKIGKKEPFKLRLTIAEIGGAAEQNIRFKIQYDTSTAFSGATDVGTTSCVSGAWCYYNGDNATDDGGIASRVLSDSDTSGTYNEASSASTFDFTASTETEFEFTIWGYDPTANTTYYFRAYDTVNSQAVAINASGNFTYPQLTTSSSYSLSISTTATLALSDYTLGGTGTNSKQMLLSNDQELNTWDDRGTGVGWSTTAVIEHLRSETTGAPWTNISSDLFPAPHIRNTVITTGTTIVFAYNDGTYVEFLKSSDKGATWSEAITGSPTYVGEASSVPSMYIDSGDNIHLCYEEGNDIDYRLLTKSGSQWTIGSATEVVGDTATYAYQECSIIVESDGDIMVAVKGTNLLSPANITAVYRNTGGGFSVSRSVESDTDDPSLVLRNSDNVALFYIDEGTGISWDNFNGSAWAGGAMIDESLSADQYSATSDTSDKLHLTYGGYHIMYRSYSGSWSDATTINFDISDTQPSITTDNTSVWVFFCDDDVGNKSLSYYEYDGSAWDTVATIPLDAEAGVIKAQTPLRINRNQFFTVYQVTSGVGDYDGYSYFNNDLIRAGDISWSTGTVNALYGAEIGSCPSAGVCAGEGGAMDPESSITIVDADACTGSGCPANPTFGMGKYYTEPTLTISSLNLRLGGTYSGTLTITIS